MDHLLVDGIETALGWETSGRLGREFAFGRLPDPDLAVRLLTPDGALDLLRRRGLAAPQLRCLVGGKDLHPRDYLASVTTGRGQVISMADMRRIGGHLTTGCTLVVDDLGPLHPVMETACRALSWWTGDAVRVNAYLTTQEAGGWGLHWDSHDVLCVQLAGEKSWEVRGPSRPAPMETDVDPNLTPHDEVVWSGTMRPGDVMHVPRGWWHQATRTGRGAGHSLHATFGVVRRTGVDYLLGLADTARSDVLWRRDLTDGGDLAQRHRELVEAAAGLFGRYDVEDYLAERRTRSLGTRRSAFAHGLFGVAEQVACVTDLPPAVVTAGSRVTVAAAGKNITFPLAAEPSLRVLLTGNPVRSADLGPAAGPVVAVLLEHGILTALTPETAAGYRGWFPGWPTSPRGRQASAV